MLTRERDELASIGIKVIAGEITKEDIKACAVESYLNRRSELTAEELEAEIVDAIAELFTLLTVREATICAMAETIDILENEE